uniref:Peptidase S1 domain-containing protein n=1 Tax=Mesocestoides corti TaxID=53468 RepID=A0A5K3EXU2_MESCO
MKCTLNPDVDLLYELIDEKEAETRHLREELKKTQDCCVEIQSNLEEAQLIITEQQEQLAIYRQEVAVSKSNAEALKLRNFILASNSQGTTDEVQKIIDEYSGMLEEIERLRLEKKDSEMELQRLRKERSFLRKKADQRQVLVEQGAGIPEDGGKTATLTSSSRVQNSSTNANSSDTEDLIRQLREEKRHWEEYANRLVRTMVEHCPDLVDVTQTSGSEKPLTERERKWHDYALRLLADTVRTNPSCLTDFDRRLLQSVQTGVDVGIEFGVAGDAALQTTEKSTRTNFAQTRRRKIDRLKAFFQRGDRR